MNGIHETKLHGKRTFPYTVYRGVMPEYLRTFPLHWHDEMELIPVTGGQGIITVQQQRLTVRAGDLLLIPPQVVHSMEQLGDHEMEYYNILFRFSLLENSQQDSCYEKYLKPLYDGTRTVPVLIPAEDPLSQLLMPHVADLIRHRKEYREDSELLIKSHLFAIMHHLSRCSVPVSSAQHAIQSTYDKLKQALMHIQTNYNQEISVEQAASLCGFSASHFMKLFRQLTGSSFTQYLKQFRLEQAAGQLLRTEEKISTIAHQTGFQNLSYFTRAFTAQYGCSPAAYRRQTK